MVGRGPVASASLSGCVKWLRGYCCGTADGERGTDVDWNVVLREA